MELAMLTLLAGMCDNEEVIIMTHNMHVGRVHLSSSVFVSAHELFRSPWKSFNLNMKNAMYVGSKHPKNVCLILTTK